MCAQCLQQGRMRRACDDCVEEEQAWGEVEAQGMGLERLIRERAGGWAWTGEGRWHLKRVKESMSCRDIGGQDLPPIVVATSRLTGCYLQTRNPCTTSWGFYLSGLAFLKKTRSDGGLLLLPPASRLQLLSFISAFPFVTLPLSRCPLLPPSKH